VRRGSAGFVFATNVVRMRRGGNTVAEKRWKNVFVAALRINDEELSTTDSQSVVRKAHRYTGARQDGKALS
jgi:hypothetical protein